MIILKARAKIFLAKHLLVMTVQALVVTVQHHENKTINLKKRVKYQIKNPKNLIAHSMNKIEEEVVRAAEIEKKENRNKILRISVLLVEIQNFMWETCLQIQQKNSYHHFS